MRIAKYLLLSLILLATTALACVYLAPGPTTHFFVAVERARSGLARKEILLPDGLRMVYLEGGTGQPLMLLHGFSDDKDNFVYVARSLVAHFHLIIPDLNGFGESSRPSGANYGVTAQVERLRGLAGALGLPRLDLGGSSMGGQIALIWASAYPKEVTSLWLLDPGGLRGVPPSDLDTLKQKSGVNPIAGSDKAAFDKEASLAMSAPPPIPKPILDYIGEQRAKNKPMEAIISRDLSVEAPLEPRISGLQTPTLIVWGKQDHMINPIAASLLHGLLPRSKVILMDGAGHLPMLEKPEQSAADYLAFRREFTQAP